MKNNTVWQRFCFILMLFVTTILNATPPTFLLVHGALFTGAVWQPVASYLEDKGYNVLTVDTPGRLNDGVKPNESTLPAAVDKVCALAKDQDEPIILVGHNQAGAIITQATAHCPKKIKGLVYIAAVLPMPGERPFDVLSDQDNYHFDLSAPLDTQTGLSIPDQNAPIQKLFMADADNKTAETVIKSMVPEPIIFAYDILNYDLKAFQTFPKYYIKTSDDLVIEPASQDKFLARQPMNQTFTLKSSHCPFISKPKKLSELLIQTNALISTL